MKVDLEQYAATGIEVSEHRCTVGYMADFDYSSFPHELPQQFGYDPYCGKVLSSPGSNSDAWVFIRNGV
jgi:hypothetical protein